MKAIIYYRKSTDRDDKQANSLEHQLTNCRRTADVNGFNIIEEIGESKSAKTEGTRPWFNKILKLCKTWRIDFIVIDEPKRLSRNNLDSARIIDLLDKKQVKWIYSTGRIYLADQINDVFLLQLDLSLSKMDNDHRSKDVKEKMLTCINNTKRFLWKAPFGYKNITLKKWHKEIVVNEKEAKIVKEIFALRLQNKAYSTIAKLIKAKYENRISMRYTANKMNEIVNNKFYYGVFLWTWKEIIGSHKLLINKETYDKANRVWKGVHEQEKTLVENEISKLRTYYFKWFVKDSSGIKLSSYEKKWFTYYSNQGRSDIKISINENILFEQIEQIIKSLENQKVSQKWINQSIITDLLNHEKLESWSEKANIEKEIATLKKRQEKLLDMKLDEVISETTYLFKYNQIENEIRSLIEQKWLIEKDNFLMKTQILFELSESLYKSYFTATKEWKMNIIKKLLFELLVNTKKEFQIAETPLFRAYKMLKNRYGGPKEFDIRTYIEQLSRINLEDLKQLRNFVNNTL